MDRRLNKKVIYIAYILALCSIRACAVDFGGKCSASPSEICNQTAFLECDSTLNLCRCQSPDQSYYDETQKICKILAHGACAKGEGQMPCADFSVCTSFVSEALRCECAGNYIVSNGKCVLPYGAACRGSGIPSCDTSAFIECSTSTGTCACANSTNKDIRYEPSTKSCALLEMATCSVDTGSMACVEKAECKLISGKHICSCANGVSNSTNRACVAYHGEECDKPGSGKCKSEYFQTCVAGKCACDSSNPEVRLDTKSGSCALLAGSNCTKDGMPCTYQGQCSSEGICECQGPLSPSLTRKCALNYGDICNYYPSGLWNCDREDAFLFCTKDKCGCDFGELFEDKMCKYMAGKSCNSNSKMECVAHAKCNGTSNTCDCDEALELTPGIKGTCVRKYNATCGPDLLVNCDSDGHQNCVDGHCACAAPSDMAFNPKDSKCYLQFNRTCTTEPGDAPCGSTFVCGNTSKRCECNGAEGFVFDGKSACVKKLGTECDYYSGHEGYCDPKDSLRCSPNEGRCVCDNNSTLVGAECLKNIGVTCDVKDGVEGRCNRNEYMVCNGGFCDCDGAHAPNDDLTACAGNVNAPCQSNKHCKVEEFLHCNVTAGKCEGYGSAGARFYLNFQCAVVILIVLIVRPTILN